MVMINIVRDKLVEACIAASKDGWKIRPGVTINQTLKTCCILGAIGIYNKIELPEPSPISSTDHYRKDQFLIKCGELIQINKSEQQYLMAGFDNTFKLYNDLDTFYMFSNVFYNLGHEFYNRTFIKNEFKSYDE